MSKINYIKYELVQATLADVKPGEIFHFGKEAPEYAQDHMYFMTANGHMYSPFSWQYFDITEQDLSRSVRVQRPAPKVYFPVVGTVIASYARSYVRTGPDQWKCTDPRSSGNPFTDAEMFFHEDEESFYTVLYQPGDQDEG